MRSRMISPAQRLAVTSIILALLHIVTGQSCALDSSLYWTSQDNATAAAECPDYSSSFQLHYDVAGNFTMHGIRKIRGDLTVDDAQSLTSLSANDLEEVEGELKLSFSGSLTTVEFPRLKKVGSLRFDSVPLSNAKFDSVIDNITDRVSITNTSLTSLEGINPSGPDYVSVYITDNAKLRRISMNMQRGSFRAMNNGPDILVDLPLLEGSPELNISQCGSVNLPMLNSTLEARFSRCSFKTLSLPRLATGYPDLVFADNPYLESLQLDALETASSLEITANRRLRNVTFPTLQRIGSGGLDIHGDIESVYLPNLTRVGYWFNVQSSQPLCETCERFQRLRENEDVFYSGSYNPETEDGFAKSGYTCVGGLREPGRIGTLPDGTSIGTDDSIQCTKSSGTRSYYHFMSDICTLGSTAWIIALLGVGVARYMV